MYCIYTDKEITLEEANSEHIIPLALGGVNGFEILVSSSFNSNVGSSIDGEMANCFFMMFKRRDHDARGHSRKTPIPIAKKSTIQGLGTPVQISFARDRVKVFSPILRKELTDEEMLDQSFTLIVQLKPDARARFSAKVALSSGYFIYGDIFRDNAKISDLHTLINFDRASSTKEKDFYGFETKGWYWPKEVTGKDKSEHHVYEYIAQYLNCSFVLVIPTTSSIIFVIGIFGDLVGILNCPAKTELLPNNGDYDLGHAIILQNKSIRRMSYRKLLREIHEKLQYDEQQRDKM
jgi:hypothetical protein